MESIVVSDEFHENDFKPTELLQRYVEMTAQDVQVLLLKQPLENVVSPVNVNDKGEKIFDRFGMTYREDKTGTLFVSPRPTDDMLRDYYKEAPSRRFWEEQLSSKTGQKRQQKIIKPRFEWLLDSTQEYLSDATHWLDINTHQYGYIESMASTEFFKQKTLLDPYLTVEPMHLDSLTVVHESWKNARINNVDVISLFEVIERTSDVNALLNQVHGFLRSGGLCFITTILASGFDIQTLGSYAENLYPPDRLNVFSIDGLRALVERHGFECAEISTPGILDIEIVAKAQRENPSLKLSKFADQLINKKDDFTRQAFQQFLQANLMSSYGRILLKKK